MSIPKIQNSAKRTDIRPSPPAFAVDAAGMAGRAGRVLVGWPEAKQAINGLALLAQRLPANFQSTVALPGSGNGAPPQTVTLVTDGMGASVVRKTNGKVVGSLVLNAGTASCNQISLGAQSSPTLLKQAADLAGYGQTLAETWLARGQTRAPADKAPRPTPSRDPWGPILDRHLELTADAINQAIDAGDMEKAVRLSEAFQRALTIAGRRPRLGAASSHPALRP